MLNKNNINKSFKMKAHLVVIENRNVSLIQVNEAVLKRKRSLGITQVIIGVLSILFGILSVQSLDNSRHRYGHSGWGGIWASFTIHNDIFCNDQC